MTIKDFIAKYEGWFSYTRREELKKEMETDLEEMFAALHQPLVSGSLPCHHNFIQKDTYWKSCTHCGMLAPLGQ